jgi:hypothetical protein
MFAEGTRIVGGNVILARETLLEAEEAGGGAIAMGTTMFGAAHVAVILVNCGEVGSAALGASEEGFGALAVGNGVS